MPFERKDRPSGLPTQIIRSKPARPEPSARKTKEVSLLSRIRNFFGIASTAMLAAVVFVSPASAATSGCSNQWANAFKPSIDTFTSNSKGLYVTFAVAIVVLALVALAFLHATRHRGILIATILGVIAVAVLLPAAPAIITSLTAHACG